MPKQHGSEDYEGCGCGSVAGDTLCCFQQARRLASRWGGVRRTRAPCCPAGPGAVEPLVKRKSVCIAGILSRQRRDEGGILPPFPLLCSEARFLSTFCCGRDAPKTAPLRRGGVTTTVLRHPNTAAPFEGAIRTSESGWGLDELHVVESRRAVLDSLGRYYGRGSISVALARHPQRWCTSSLSRPYRASRVWAGRDSQGVAVRCAVSPRWGFVSSPRPARPASRGAEAGGSSPEGAQ
jgi:hypothetical protein